MPHFFIAILLLLTAVRAEYPYKASVKLDVPLAIGATSVLAFGLYRLNAMTPDDRPYDRNDLLPWDRPFAGTWNEPAIFASNIFMVAGALPLVFGINQDFATHTLLLYEVLALQGGLQLMVRSMKVWPRPFMLGSEGGKERENPSSYGSFYSGHASAAFAIAVFTGVWFSDAYPGSSYSPWVWGSALSVATMIGVLRIAGGKHYPSDVLVGALVGSFAGWVVPRLHRNSNNNAPAAVPGYIGWRWSF
ncbi:MAG: phosphatase PAP2 family protein [Fibromonadales bacterium]|nr:phosphatase PAP2 family protein [Fibromonadales bacterium]